MQRKTFKHDNKLSTLSFKKGYTPWNKGGIGPNKGKKFSLEHRIKLSKSHIGLRNQKSIDSLLKYAVKGIKHPKYKHGLSIDPVYRSWQKNQWHSRKQANGGTHTFGEWDDLKNKYNHTCPACGRSEPEIKLTEDHIIPISKGGSNNIDNIQPLCMKCNLRKHIYIINYPISSQKIRKNDK